MSNVIALSDKQNVEDIIAKEKRVVILFTQPSTCIPCRNFKPHYDRAALSRPDVVFLVVDLDGASWPTVDYGIYRVPTVQLYENGQFSRYLTPAGAAVFLKDLGD